MRQINDDLVAAVLKKAAFTLTSSALDTRTCTLEDDFVGVSEPGVTLLYRPTLHAGYAYGVRNITTLLAFAQLTDQFGQGSARIAPFQLRLPLRRTPHRKVCLPNFRMSIPVRV